MRAATIASLAMLCFSALTSFALVSWLHVTHDPWAWKALLTATCAALAVMASALLWFHPRRSNALLGAIIMLASLARVGGPSEWTWVSFALVAATFLLMMPLVHAAIVLREDDR